MSALTSGINGVLAIDATADAIEFERQWIRWGEIAEAKHAIESMLADLPPHTRVGVMMRNRPETIAPVLACVASDYALVTINPVYPDDRLCEDIASLGTPVIIGARTDWERRGVDEAARRAGALCIETERDLSARIRHAATRPASDFARATAPGVAVEMLTSGTTGKPKRIPLRAASFERAVLSALNFESGRKEGDAPVLRNGVQLLTGPVSHIGGLMAFLNAILSGRRACLLERFTVESFHDAVKRHRPKVAGAPPAALRMLMDANIPPEDFSSLSAFRTGTAPLDPDLADAFYARFGVPVLQNYGATEFGGVAGWTIADFKTHWRDKRGAVGRINPGIEARAVDAESGDVLAPGAAGVLELRGKQIGDGESWVRTTDIAVVDADKFLFIRGRADNAIIRGGFKVHPDDVVAALEEHEAIREAAVIGLPDERLGHAPAAAYVLRAGAEAPNEAELSTFLRARLAPYQVPTRYLQLDELPRTSSMKVSQPDLRALFGANT